MTSPGRLASLDALQGFAITGMVLVNNPGSWSHIYAALAHAEWNGCTFTDLIFPFFFLFAAGLALTLSLGTRAQLAAIALPSCAASCAAQLVPVPGADGLVAAGRLEPGLDFGAWLDRLLLVGHLWPKVRIWDPEGLMGTPPFTPRWMKPRPPSSW